MTSIRTILSLVVVEDLHLEQLDVKTGLSPGGFGGRDLYAEATRVWGQREGEFVLQIEEELVWPKAAPRQWYLKFDKFLIEQGYDRCHFDHCVYFKRLENGKYIILLLYVDDMLVVGSNM